MTRIEIRLPDDVAERAERAGLLSEGAIRQLLEDAMRRRAGRALLEVAQHLRDVGIPPMTMDEVDAEVKAFRAERPGRPGAAADRR